jgi:hypothetical protein
VQEECRWEEKGNGFDRVGVALGGDKINLPTARIYKFVSIGACLCILLLFLGSLSFLVAGIVFLCCLFSRQSSITPFTCLRLTSDRCFGAVANCSRFPAPPRPYGMFSTESI